MVLSNTSIVDQKLSDLRSEIETFSLPKTTLQELTSLCIESLPSLTYKDENHDSVKYPADLLSIVDDENQPSNEWLFMIK